MQQGADLLFIAPRAHDGHLLFGRTDDAAPPVQGDDAVAWFDIPLAPITVNIGGQIVDPHHAAFDIHLPPLVVSVTGGVVEPHSAAFDIGFEPFAFGITGSFREPHRATFDIAFPDIAVNITGAYNSGVHRAVTSGFQGLSQPARTVHAGLHARFQQARPNSAITRETGQQAQPITTGVHARGQATQLLGSIVTERYELAFPVHTGLQTRWQTALRIGSLTTERYQPGQPLHYLGIYGFQTAYFFRTLAVSRFEQGIARRAEWFTSANLALALAGGPFVGRHQQAMWPPPGVRVDDRRDGLPCYVSDGNFVFRTLRTHDGHLVFECCECGQDGQPPGGPGTQTIFVPRRRVHIVRNTITLTRLDGQVDLHPLTFSAELDVDSWTWSWSATLHASKGVYLGRQADGNLPIVEAVINGQALRLQLETRSLDERFNPVRWRVGGRGANAVLSGQALNFTSSEGLSAQQLAAHVLTDNGVGIGWDLDWQLPDWHVPAGVWARTGGYIDAIKDIASAAGGYVQPDLTAQVLHVLPRYPVLPWHWANKTPDYDIPDGAAEVRGTDFVDKPPHNSVWVGGESAGVAGFITRTGTAGDSIADQFLHPLITAPEAQLAAGGAILADSGQQEHVQLSWQVFPETGLILPGKFVRQSWPASSGRKTFGISRRIAISFDYPKLRQTITLETHPDV